MKPVTRPPISPPTRAEITIFVPFGSQKGHIYAVYPKSVTTIVRMAMQRSKLNALRTIPTYFSCRFSLIILAPYVEVMIMVECDISDH